ncbi:unnamed protein product, partial [Didymodactylos carnosus]
FCFTIPSLIVIVFTEASLRLYNALVHQPGTVVSWDATGSIVRNNNNDLRLCYELTLSVSNTAPHDRSIPISFLISSDHSQPIIDFWLSKLKYGYMVICFYLLHNGTNDRYQLREINNHNQDDPNQADQDNCVIFNEVTVLETINSGFKASFTEIYENIEKSHEQQPQSLMTDEDRKKTDSNIKFIKYILKWCMPSVIIWSNLLVHPNIQIQRSNAQSEREMGITKIVHLGGVVNGRIDVVLDTLIEKQMDTITFFAEHYFMNKLNQQVQIKSKFVADSGASHYAASVNPVQPPPIKIDLSRYTDDVHIALSSASTYDFVSYLSWKDTTNLDNLYGFTRYLKT